MFDYLYARQDLWKVADRMREWHESLFRHSVEVANRAAAVALAMGCPEAEAELVMLAGFLHDYGKITWPKELVQKHPLDEDDWQIVRLHPLQGARLAQEQVPGLSRVVLRIIEEHHEKNGNGYPRGLGTHEIHPLSKIVSCVECYTAMTEERPYRIRSLSAKEAIEIISTDGFDGEVVQVLRRAVVRGVAV